MKMKRIVIILTVFAALALGASAQNKDTFYPGWKASVLGGVNYVSSDGWTLGFLKQVSPNFQVGLEYDFLPWFGVRGAVNGMMAKYPTNPFYQNQYSATANYVLMGVDALFDFSNMEEYKFSRAVNPYMYLGAGADIRFKTERAEQYIGPAIRGGLGFNFRLSNSLKLVLELQYNVLGNKFNTIDDNNFLGGLWDDDVAALTGFQFDMGGKRRRAEEAEHEAQVAAARAAQAAAAQATADRIAAARAAQEREAAERRAQREAELAAINPAAASETISFGIYEYTIPARESGRVRHIISVLNQFPDAVVTITGYSDKDSESEMPEFQLSKLRLDNILKAMTDAGIDESRITVINNGFTVPEGSTSTHNRLVIIETE